ncbi:hypothetical protein B0J17DRAFT_724268 [Rhizoctonia solani]|nr:hypothetical protein B0J17DRAFT_724268 [Rhizoctonia solani]
MSKGSARVRTPIANQWVMNNDEQVYANPERFDPSRFSDPSTPEASAFGFGRRYVPIPIDT